MRNRDERNLAHGSRGQVRRADRAVPKDRLLAGNQTFAAALGPPAPRGRRRKTAVAGPSRGTAAAAGQSPRNCRRGAAASKPPQQDRRCETAAKGPLPRGL
jgi:hypothetical protein